jgi:DNA-directed RNA polymerase subunit RPC12/RpoP
VNCPKCNKEIPFSLVSTRGVAHCPYCGNALYIKAPSPIIQNSVSSTWRTVGFIGLASGLVLLLAALFAAFYEQTMTFMGYTVAIGKPYASYTFPLVIAAILAFVVGIAGREQSARKR